MRGKGARAVGRVAPGDESHDVHGAPVPLADRRRLRSSRTHISILGALIDLVESGNPQPSAREIAEQAGIGRRSIFHHFGDVSLLYLAAADLQASRHGSLVVPIAPRGPFESRVGGLCHQRRELFEAVGPVFRAASARNGGPGCLDSHLAEHRAVLRGQLAETLAPELAGRGPTTPLLLDTLEMATGWAHWHALRFENHHPATEAERLMASAVVRSLY